MPLDKWHVGTAAQVHRHFARLVPCAHGAGASLYVRVKLELPLGCLFGGPAACHHVGSQQPPVPELVPNSRYVYLPEGISESVTWMSFETKTLKRFEVVMTWYSNQSQSQSQSQSGND